MRIHCGINRYAVILGIKGLAYCMDKEMHTTDIKFVGLIIDYNISCVFIIKCIIICEVCTEIISWYKMFMHFNFVARKFYKKFNNQ